MINRRRSQSASVSSSHHRSPQASFCTPTKRAYPHSAFNPFTLDHSTSHTQDADGWRSKRRRRESSPSGTSSDDDSMLESYPRTNNSRIVTPPPVPVFAATSAEFHFFPQKDARIRHSGSNSISTAKVDPQNEAYSYSELSRLKSSAFWELKRSVMENGEGLVRRMRDYEHSRSRSDAFYKVKDAQKRGRKRSSLIVPVRKASSLQTDSESESEDDIQIFSGEIPQVFLSRDTQSRSSRGILKHSMEESGRPEERCSSPCSVYMSDSFPDPLYQYRRNDDPARSTLTSTPTLTHSTSSSNSSINSLTLPPVATSPASVAGDSYPPTASRSEKALAALSLAMANGAGSITEDYEALRALQPVLALDDSEVGEMWH